MWSRSGKRHLHTSHNRALLNEMASPPPRPRYVQGKRALHGQRKVRAPCGAHAPQVKTPSNVPLLKLPSMSENTLRHAKTRGVGDK